MKKIDINYIENLIIEIENNKQELERERKELLKGNITESRQNQYFETIGKIQSYSNVLLALRKILRLAEIDDLRGDK